MSGSIASEINLQDIAVHFQLLSIKLKAKF